MTSLLQTPSRMTCRYCGVSQPVTEFEVCRVFKGVSYRRRQCKKCKQTAQGERRKKLRRWLEEYKTTLFCERCGFDDFRALEFHHTGGKEKDFNIGDMVRLGLSVARIKEEIEKCTILCANCHRIEHYDERQ